MDLHIKKEFRNLESPELEGILKKLLSYVSVFLLVRSLELPFLRYILDQIKMYLKKSKLYHSVVLNHYHFRNKKLSTFIRTAIVSVHPQTYLYKAPHLVIKFIFLD